MTREHANDSSDSDSMRGFGLDEPDEQWLARLHEAESAEPLTSIGSYELLEEISRGGQGVVYRARQRDSRRVLAIKRLLGGSVASLSSRRRLDRELETAASLRHGGIVNVLGIEVADGQPMLTMEWIDGVPITQWAAGDEKRKSPRETIAVVLAVCAALQHAHQRGVIHRDLKPSNILIDPHGHPHILDFGLAKFVQEHRSDEHSELTVAGQFLGTLVYASPEQLAYRGDAVDVRSDLYQLGLIVYEMLTERLPFRPASTPREAIADRDHCDVPRPSSINREIDRDLDAIVLKAIALNPAERYQSADALAADLSRHQAGEPILARAPGTLYLVRKLLRRHRVAFVFIATALGLVLIGGGTATILALRLAAAQTQEHRARNVAEQVNSFLHQMLASADPNTGSDHDLTAREMLENASRKLEDQFVDQPQVKAALDETIGRAYLGLGVYESAERHLLSSLSLRERQDQGSADLAESLSGLAELRYAQRQFPEAETCSRRALQLLETQPKSELNEAAIARELNNLGVMRRAQGDPDQAESLLRRALEIRRRAAGPDSLDVAESLNNLANVQRGRHNFPDAESLCRQVLDIRRKRFGPNHVLVAQSLDNLGVVIGAQGRSDESIAFLQQAQTMYRDLLGPDHPDVAISAGNLGRLLFQAQRYAEAAPLLGEALRIRLLKMPPGDQRTSQIRQMRGVCLLNLKQFADAEPLLLQSLEDVRSASWANHSDRDEVLRSLAELYEQSGQQDEAERYKALITHP